MVLLASLFSSQFLVQDGGVGVTLVTSEGMKIAAALDRKCLLSLVLCQWDSILGLWRGKAGRTQGCGNYRDPLALDSIHYTVHRSGASQGPSTLTIPFVPALSPKSKSPGVLTFQMKRQVREAQMTA